MQEHAMGKGRVRRRDGWPARCCGARTQYDLSARKWQRQWIQDHIAHGPCTQTGIHAHNAFLSLIAAWEWEEAGSPRQASSRPSPPAPPCLSCVMGRMHNPRDAENLAPCAYASPRPGVPL